MTALTQQLFHDIVEPVLKNVIQRNMLQWVDFAEVHIAVNEALEKAQQPGTTVLEKIVALYNELYAGAEFDAVENMHEMAAAALKEQR